MFGRRRREDEAAADAARETERRALFTRLAERPEAICPFLGLDDDRTGYIDGVSDDHRCFAFGEPAAISAEQQTRVCQEPGYGNCPRYLRGVLVIPTEELEALRRPHAPLEMAAAAQPTSDDRRRRAPIFLLIGALVLMIGGGVGAFLLIGGDGGIANATPTPTLEPVPTDTEPSPSATLEPSDAPTPTVEPSTLATPTPEPTPELGDQFAFYEVSVGLSAFTLYELNTAGDVADSRVTSFSGYSFAQAAPVEGTDGEVYWVTDDGALAGWSYRYPDSGEFRIRAVYLNSDGDRRSVYLEQDALDDFPEATPAP